MLTILVLTFSIILAIQICFFLLAVFLRTDKLTDLVYGLTFVFIVLLYFLANPKKEIVPILITILITVWGARLAIYFFVRILKTKKDERFDKIRNDIFRFGMFWFFQTVTIWIILMPAIIVLTSRNVSGFPTVAIVGLVTWLIGFIIESIADQQKFIFKGNPQNKDRWITNGLWKYSRHPNYFGEILVWIGIFTICVPYLSGIYILTIISPIFITFILLFVSGIPPLEKRYNEKFKNNPCYQNYKKRTSLLIPLPNSK